jgi:hypothetical protein
VKPAGVAGEKVLRIASQPALQIASLDDQQRLVCMVKVDLGQDRGVAGVGAQARSRDQDVEHNPCVVSAKLAAEIVKRTS